MDGLEESAAAVLAAYETQLQRIARDHDGTLPAVARQLEAMIVRGMRTRVSELSLQRAQERRDRLARSLRRGRRLGG